MSASQKELANFKKGTKRDAIIYSIFRCEKCYDSIHRAFHDNEKAQGLSSIIDPQFKYHDSFVCEFFDDQQSFMYLSWSQPFKLNEEGNSQRNLGVMRRESLKNCTSTTPSLRLLSMNFFSSPLTSPTSQ